jgi:hypothetical protein
VNRPMEAGRLRPTLPVGLRGIQRLQGGVIDDQHFVPSLRSAPVGRQPDRDRPGQRHHAKPNPPRLTIPATTKYASPAKCLPSSESGP